MNSTDPKRLSDWMAQECIAVRLRYLNRRVTKIYDDALRPFGVRIAQGNLLCAIACRGPLRAADLGNALALDPSTLSRDLDRMIRRGWIEKLPDADGRAHQLRITESGARLLADAMPSWEEAQAEASGLLGASFLSALFPTVRRHWQAA